MGIFIWIINLLLTKKNFKILNNFSFLIFCIGILILFISLKTFNTNSLGPSFITLFPLFGSALILISENKNSKFVFYFIKNKIISYISLISFSLYLYHQPIFAIFRIRNYEIIEFKNWFILIPITFLISHLSYIYVEKVFKNEEKIG